MKEHISIRQITFLYIFISITPILSYIPKTAASNGNNSGYMVAFYYALILCIFAALLLNIVKVYPDKNFYEILQSLFGTYLAKIILFLYGLWGLLFTIYKTSSYSLLLKTTLMPQTASYITITALFMLIIYAVLKGTETIFRVAELLYGPVLIILAFLFFFAFTSINREYLVPISSSRLLSNLKSLPSLAAVGGNLSLLLLFLKPVTQLNHYATLKRRIYQAVLVFSLLSISAIILAIGISGASLTGKYTYSLFQTLKCISLFQTFQRFDSIITILCFFSDFVSISVFFIIFIKCLQNAFPALPGKELGLAVFTIGCVYVIIRDISLYEMETTCRIYMEYISLVFQYIIPVILGIICIFKKAPAQAEKTVPKA